VRALVAAATVPVVLDADGLNAFAGEGPRLIAGRRDARLILTPHPGEAARLTGQTPEAIQADRVGAARAIAVATNAWCVLKGYRTVVAAPDGQAFLNPTGNPGLATAGSGDVLTGLIAGLVAQGLEPLDAAILGVFLHGLAADLAVAGPQCELTLIAGDVIDHLPDAMRLLAGTDDEDGSAPDAA
jgi:NAD(P)H-hydrate epimerase